jgi:FKBP-type peptidyl-prolyl cis-trans isomerase
MGLHQRIIVHSNNQEEMIIRKGIGIAALSVMLLSAACSSSQRTANTQDMQITTEKDSISYALGVIMAKNVRMEDVELDESIFAAGFKASLTGDSLAMPVEECDRTLQNFMMAQAERKSSANKEEGEAFLVENANRSEVTVTESGLQYEVLTEGSGEKPLATDKVTVHYTGKLLNGEIFDSSVERGQPATFGLNQVIRGWTEGVQLMNVGSKYRFYIPSELAYGDRGAGEMIGPGSTLIFDVELLEIAR